MKNLKKIAAVLIVMFFISSCQNESIERQNENQSATVEIAKNNESSGRLIDLSFIRVDSDLVNADHGCFTVNVRVYFTNIDGDEYLVANENVQVGECGDGERNRNGGNNKCEGALPNGDYVVDNGTVGDRECLYDLLIENSKAYELYLISVDNTINGK